MITKPMLAEKFEDNDYINKIKYPVYCSYKLDGIRALVINGELVSRKFKPIPNHYLRNKFKVLPNGIDGELMLPNQAFTLTTSAVMTEDSINEDVRYFIFDYVKDSLSTPYLTRIKHLEEVSKSFIDCELVLPRTVNNPQELIRFEEESLDLGYEGIMIRINGKYKCGRSTLNEGLLLKMKRFMDSEAEILSFKEKEHNTNEATKDELGHTKRSSCKVGMVGADTLGTILVRDIKSGVEFGIGSGFDDEQRKEIWMNRDKYLGKLVKYKYQPYGEKNLPRFPTFEGFRDTIDMD